MDASPKRVSRQFRAHSVLPGFNLALGYALLYLLLIVLIPLLALFFKTATLGLEGFWDVVTGERVLASLRCPIHPVSLFGTFVGGISNCQIQI